MPGVVAASRSRFTSSASGRERVWTARMLARPSLSGAGTATRRSKRPGRSSAASRISGRLVAPSTITATLDSKPSISVRIWLSVCSRSSLPPRLALELRERPIASSSSMKMIDGEASFACLNRSRTREAPMPTIASTNSDAEIEKNGTPGLSRDRARQQRLAGARAAGEQHAAGDPAAELLVALGALEEVDDLRQLGLRLVDAGHVGEGDLLLAALDAARLGARRRRRPRPSPRRPRPHGGRSRRTGRSGG